MNIEGNNMTFVHDLAFFKIVNLKDNSGTVCAYPCVSVSGYSFKPNTSDLLLSFICSTDCKRYRDFLLNQISLVYS